MAVAKTADQATDQETGASTPAGVTFEGDALALFAIAAARSSLQSRGSAASRAVAAMLADAAPAMTAQARRQVRADVSAYGAAQATGDPWQDMDAEPWAALLAALDAADAAQA